MWKSNDRVSCIESKNNSYLTGDNGENKKAKGTKKVSKNFFFEDYKHCLEATQHEKNKPSRKKQILWS